MALAVGAGPTVRPVAVAAKLSPAPALEAAAFSAHKQRVAGWRRKAGVRPRPLLALRPGPPAPLVQRRAAARLLRQRPQAPAEVGLGTTVLGVLGLVALPIALLGLLLSGGGLVWGIVAGAAALAVLVAKLDPFG